jgi:DNA repair protein RadC
MYTDKERQAIDQAIAIIESKFDSSQLQIREPGMAKEYCVTKLSGLECEVFGVMFLNTKHKVIGFEEMFRGTIDGSAVYPREVVKEALRRNAAAVILTHNHPSGSIEPSQSDIAITRRLKDALSLVDVRVLDHVIVGGAETCSMAERGHL